MCTIFQTKQKSQTAENMKQHGEIALSHKLSKKESRRDTPITKSETKICERVTMLTNSHDSLVSNLYIDMKNIQVTDLYCNF